MKHLRLILGWVLATCLFVAGLYLLGEFAVSAVLLILASLLFLPSVKNLIWNVAGRNFSFGSRCLMIGTLIVTSYVSLGADLLRSESELSHLDAKSRARQQFTQSQRRHSKLLFSDDWNHGLYVESRGVTTCRLCHNVNSLDSWLVGPACVTCHSHPESFRNSLIEILVDTSTQAPPEITNNEKQHFEAVEKRHAGFLGIDAWNHAEFVRNYGVDLCVICHSLGPGGPNMSGRGPRCTSCHTDIEAFDTLVESEIGSRNVIKSVY